jgi:polar amino acid transport system permease protein
MAGRLFAARQPSSGAPGPGLRRAGRIDGTGMHYVFQFGVVWDNWQLLLDGALATLWMSAAAFLLGLALAILCTRAQKTRARILVRAYVEVIRNTPLLVQLFIVYFSLPAIGIQMDADDAAVLGLGLNFGAYATEILRSGIEAIPHGQIEAATALGLRPFRIFRHVILRPAIRVCYPGLAAQFILILLGSSVVSAISAEELTSTVNSLQSTTFRSFEFYFAATFIYLAMAGITRLLMDLAFWAAFIRGRPTVRT